MVSFAVIVTSEENYGYENQNREFYQPHFRIPVHKCEI